MPKKISPEKATTALPFYPMPPDQRNRYDEFVEIPAVTMHDRHWFDRLAATELTPEAIGGIQRILAIDRNLLPLHFIHNRSNDDTASQIDAIRSARVTFYHDILHLNDPSNPNAKSFSVYKKKLKPESLPPVSRFITAQRQLAAAGLDVPYLFARAPELYANSAHKNGEGIRTMTDLGMTREEMTKTGYLFLILSNKNMGDKRAAMTASGLDFTSIVTNNGSAVGLSVERIQRRVRTVERIVKILGLPMCGQELLNGAPFFLNMSDSKLFAVARLVGDHADSSTLPPTIERARKLSKLPVASLAQCVLNTGELTTVTAEKLQNTIPDASRKALFHASVDDAQKAAHITPATKRAVLRYLNER